jgi:hypothetical protein
MSLNGWPFGDGSTWCEKWGEMAADPKWQLWKRVRASERKCVRDLIVKLVQNTDTIQTWETIHPLPWPKTKLTHLTPLDIPSLNVINVWECRIHDEQRLHTHRVGKGNNQTLEIYPIRANLPHDTKVWRAHQEWLRLNPYYESMLHCEANWPLVLATVILEYAFDVEFHYGYLT